jgi:hypothetical protein
LLRRKVVLTTSSSSTSGALTSFKNDLTHGMT